MEGCIDWYMDRLMDAWIDGSMETEEGEEGLTTRTRRTAAVMRTAASATTAVATMAATMRDNVVIAII